MKIKIIKNKKVISEAAKGPPDLPENTYVTVKTYGLTDAVEVLYTTKDGKKPMQKSEEK